MQTIKNKAFRVSVQWNALVRKPLSLERGGFTTKIKELSVGDSSSTLMGLGGVWGFVEEYFKIPLSLYGF